MVECSHKMRLSPEIILDILISIQNLINSLQGYVANPDIIETGSENRAPLTVITQFRNNCFRHVTALPCLTFHITSLVTHIGSRIYTVFLVPEIHIKWCAGPVIPGVPPTVIIILPPTVNCIEEQFEVLIFGEYDLLGKT